MEPTERAILRLRERPQQNPDLQQRLEEEEIATSAQRRQLRDLIQSKVFWTLWIQLAFLFLLMLFQGFKWGGFSLNEWAFGFLVNGTLVETFFIVKFIVIYLFPNGSEVGKPSKRAD